MKRLLQFVIIAAGVAATVSAQPAAASDVSRRMVMLEVRDAACPEIISTLAMMNKLPTGFQQKAGTAEAELERKRDVVFPRAVPLPLLMNAVTGECPGYSWSGGSTLNVFPTPKEQSVLDVTLVKFDVSGLTAEATLDRIFGSPEVKRYMEENKLSRSIAHKGLTSSNANAAKFTLAVANKSVREILNHMVANADQKIWIYQGPAGKERELNLRMF